VKKPKAEQQQAVNGNGNGNGNNNNKIDNGKAQAFKQGVGSTGSNGH
jgi:hypothetical protein